MVYDNTLTRIFFHNFNNNRDFITIFVERHYLISVKFDYVCQKWHDPLIFILRAKYIYMVFFKNNFTGNNNKNVQVELNHQNKTLVLQHHEIQINNLYYLKQVPQKLKTKNIDMFRPYHTAIFKELLKQIFS